LSGGVLSGRFCLGWLLSVPVLSEYICYIRKLNITLNFMFRMYDKKFISVTSHALSPLPLSQTVTPSRTPSPSSMTYFMDGPLPWESKQFQILQTNWSATWHYRFLVLGWHCLSV